MPDQQCLSLLPMEILGRIAQELAFDKIPDISSTLNLSLTCHRLHAASTPWLYSAAVRADILFHAVPSKSWQDEISFPNRDAPTVTTSAAAVDPNDPFLLTACRTANLGLLDELLHAAKRMCILHAYVAATFAVTFTCTGLCDRLNDGKYGYPRHALTTALHVAAQHDTPTGEVTALLLYHVFSPSLPANTIISVLLDAPAEFACICPWYPGFHLLGLWPVCTPLILATAHGRVAAAKKLIASGAAWCTSCHMGDKGLTGVQAMVVNGQAEILEWLAEQEQERRRIEEQEVEQGGDGGGAGNASRLNAGFIDLPDTNAHFTLDYLRHLVKFGDLNDDGDLNDPLDGDTGEISEVTEPEATPKPRAHYHLTSGASSQYSHSYPSQPPPPSDSEPFIPPPCILSDNGDRLRKALHALGVHSYPTERKMRIALKRWRFTHKGIPESSDPERSSTRENPTLKAMLMLELELQRVVPGWMEMWAASNQSLVSND